MTRLSKNVDELLFVASTKGYTHSSLMRFTFVEGTESGALYTSYGNDATLRTPTEIPYEGPLHETIEDIAYSVSLEADLFWIQAFGLPTEKRPQNHALLSLIQKKVNHLRDVHGLQAVPSSDGEPSVSFVDIHSEEPLRHTLHIPELLELTDDGITILRNN